MSGFTLIEILIAMLVTTVGILGVAAIQLVSFQTNQSAYARSQAVYLARDILDRIRANPQGYLTTTVYDEVDSSVSADIPADPGCIASAGGCTPEEMAQQDVREWSANFGNVFDRDGFQPALPNGRGVLERVAASNDFTATVSWEESNWDSVRRVATTRQVSITARIN
jgi:type IV pilus assembly protein PilV